MKKIFPSFLFYFFLITIFLTEGLGIRGGHELSYYIVLMMPFILFLFDFFTKRPVHLPRKITALFLIFTGFSFISTIFAANIQIAFEYTLYYAAVFLIFLYVYNHRDNLKHGLVVTIYILSFIFVAYSVFLQFFLPDKWIFYLFPCCGKQFVFPLTGHNPLGSFLLLTLMMSFWLSIQTKKIRHVVLFFVFLPWFFLSFQRSAYLVFIFMISAIIYWSIKKKQIRPISFYPILSLALVVITLIFFVLTVGNKFVQPAGYKKFLFEKVGLKQRTVLNNRFYYYKIAINVMTQKPILGNGPYNLQYAFRKQMRFMPTLLSETSHNVFLDLTSENGIFAGAIFVYLIFLLISGSKKNKTLFILLITYVILAQMDFAFRFYSFFLLFFVMAALGYEEKDIIRVRKLIIVPFILATLAIFIFAGKTFYNLFLYPLNGISMRGAIVRGYRFGAKDLQSLDSTYRFLFKGDPEAIRQLGMVEFMYGFNTQARQDFQKAYRLDPTNFNMFQSIYSLTSVTEGVQKAEQLKRDYCSQLPEVNVKKDISMLYFYRQNEIFCKKIVY